MEAELENTLIGWNLASDTEELIRLFEFHKIRDKDSFIRLDIDKIDEILKDFEGREEFVDAFKTNIIKKKKLNNDTLQANSRPKSTVPNQTEDSTSFPLKSIQNQIGDVQNLSASEDVPVHERIKLIDIHYTAFQKERRIFKLLYSTFQGISILYNYAKTGEVMRMEYSRILIEEELKNSLSNPAAYLLLSQEQCEALYDETLQVFPTDKNRLAYIEQGMNSSCGRRRNGGTFWNAYDHWTSFAKRIGLKDVKTTTSDSSSKAVKVPAAKKVDLSVFHEEDPKLDLEQLQILWRAAASFRYATIYPKLSYDQIVGKYQALKGPHARDLVQIDFENRLEHGKNVVSKHDRFEKTNISQKLINHWSQMASGIVQLAITENNVAVNTRKKLIPISIEEEYFEVPGHIDALAFLLLPHLIKHSFRRKAFNDWKPTITEIADSFLKHSEPIRKKSSEQELDDDDMDEEVSDEVPTEEEQLQKIVVEHRDKYLNLGIKEVQPFILIWGSLHSKPEFYVAIDKVLYKRDSVVDAVDFCFKPFFAFNLEYSLASEPLWAFLHIGVYEIKKCKMYVSDNNVKKFVDQVDKYGGYELNDSENAEIAESPVS